MNHAKSQFIALYKKLLVESKVDNQSDFAEKVNKTPQYIGVLLSQKNDTSPGIKFQQEIIKKYKLPKDHFVETSKDAQLQATLQENKDLKSKNKELRERIMEVQAEAYEDKKKIVELLEEKMNGKD